MRPTCTSLRTVAVAAAVVVVGAACGSSSRSGSDKPKSGSSATTIVNVPQGGTLTIGAEEEPAVLNWIDQCSGSSWGSWIAQVETMPNAFRTVPTGAPTRATSPSSPAAFSRVSPRSSRRRSKRSRIDQPHGRVVRRRPDHVRRLRVHGRPGRSTASNISTATGYTDIATVDCPQPQTPGRHLQDGHVVRELEAAVRRLVPHLYPSHILKGQDRDALMKNGYSWSGGPW